MAIKRIKDESQLVAKWKLKAGKRHYFHVFLWKNKKAFIQNTLDNEDKCSIACVNLAPTIYEISQIYDGTCVNTTSTYYYDIGSYERKIIRPKLGEIHFIKDKWGLEIVAHELCHALMHRIRQLKPNFEHIIEQVNGAEESICYEYGQWLEDIYRFLWETNPPKELYKFNNEMKRKEDQ